MLQQINSRTTFKIMGGRRFLAVTTRRRAEGFDRGFFAFIRHNRTGANAVKITALDDGRVEVALRRTHSRAQAGGAADPIVSALAVNAKAAVATFETLTGLQVPRLNTSRRGY